MDRYDAWIDLIRQRDQFYLQLAAAVLVGYVWYRLWLRRFFKLIVILAARIVLAGLLWGLLQISGGKYHGTLFFS